MMFTIPSITYKTRILIIIAGIVVLIWSGLEASQVADVVLLGWILSIFSIAYFVMARYAGQSLNSARLVKLSPVVGAGIGAMASLITALLMLFKDVRHAHVFPDYPLQMLLDILERLPIWAVSSGLVVFGGMLLVYVMRGLYPPSKS